jgi:hypothetical protein
MSEDPLSRFGQYLRSQHVDPATTADVLAQYRDEFDKAVAKRAATPPMGEIFKPKEGGLKQGEFIYAVAVREGGQLFLTMTVRRAPKGDVYVIYPRQEDNPHASYHHNGRFHQKRGEHESMEEQRQPLDASFRGSEHMGMYGGHGPKIIGAVCNPDNFTDVMEVQPGILGRNDGFVAVDLVEPGCQPLDLLRPVVATRVFKDSTPWIVVRVG